MDDHEEPLVYNPEDVGGIMQADDRGGIREGSRGGIREGSRGDIQGTEPTEDDDQILIERSAAVKCKSTLIKYGGITAIIVIVLSVVVAAILLSKNDKPAMLCIDSAPFECMCGS